MYRRNTSFILFVMMVLLSVSTSNAQQSSLSLTEAKKALAAAETEATRIGVALTCAVVDLRGDLIALSRMDQARFFTVKIAQGKARASAAFGAPSGNLSAVGAMGLGDAIEGDVFFVQGAVPINKNNQLSGAIGCSGGSGQQDEEAAKAGVNAL
tara:strand:+ start:155 stop:616 length:462 start_codon:yes stop_codon:yes gene_type:complete